MRREQIVRILRFGVQNFIRNGWLSVAATLVLALTLFIVSVFLLQTHVIKTETQQLREKLDMAIYVQDAATEEQVQAFVAQIRKYPEVKELTYLNKDQVIQEWHKSQSNQKIRDLVSSENNPLPRTIKVNAHDPSQLEAIANAVTKSSFASNIRKVSYQDNREIIQQLVARSKRTTRNGLVVSTIFILIAVLFVYNTIRLIIHFRREEIAIMKLVGATDSFIRGPFIIEGGLYGIAAGLIAVPTLYFFLKNGLQESTNLVASPDSLISNQLLQTFVRWMPHISFTLIGAAMLIAILCTWISVRNHLSRSAI